MSMHLPALRCPAVPAALGAQLSVDFWLLGAVEVSEAAPPHVAQSAKGIFIIPSKNTIFLDLEPG